MGLPLPQIAEVGMRVRVTVTLPEKIEVAAVGEQVTEQVNKLLDTLKKESLGAKEVMLALQLKHRPTLVYDYLQPAMNSGLVEMTQPDSPKSPTQRYRLTGKGRKYLKTTKENT